MSALYIKSLVENGVAARDGHMRIGDRLLQVRKILYQIQTSLLKSRFSTQYMNIIV